MEKEFKVLIDIAKKALVGIDTSTSFNELSKKLDIEKDELDTILNKLECTFT